MSEEEIDLVDQILGEGPSPSDWWSSDPPAVKVPEDAARASGDAVDADAPLPGYAPPAGRKLRLPRRFSAPHPRRPHFNRHFSVPHPRAPRRPGLGRLRTPVFLAAAFALTGLAILAISAAVALAVDNVYTDRIAPGVHIGSLDLSGLPRDQAIEEIKTAYAYMGEGKVVITTPTGSATITYQQIARGPDAEFMADQALLIGHSGNFIENAVSIGRSAISHQAIPLAVRLDPMAVATGVRDLEPTHLVQPASAGVTVQDGFVSVSKAFDGSRIDEVAISKVIVDGLIDSNAAAEFQVGEAFITIEPRIGDAEAQAAIAAFQRMSADVHLRWVDPTASPTPSATAKPGASSAAAGKSLVIPASSIRSWITIVNRPDGTFGPVVDTARVETAVSALTSKLVVAAVEPKVVFDSTGKPSDVVGGKSGVQVDVAATAQAVKDYLATLADGTATSSEIQIVTAPLGPRITKASLAGMKVIGAWTTIFYPGITNGGGANIRTPANLLNGQVVAPGEQFNFLRAVGPIDRAHGYTLGGVIKHGKSDHTGAMGGGICSASTTMFNAAANSGLEIDERNAHAYYIDRYPVGLDATVFSNGHQVYNLRWRNDTLNPIVIKSWTAGKSKAHLTIQLWSIPTGRKVSYTPAFKANVVKASDSTVYVTSLPPGVRNRAEYPTAGFDTSRTRTVTDQAGNVIHVDTWVSHYVKVDGLLEIGKSTSTPTPTPTPGPVELPQVALPTGPTPTPAYRLRRVR